MTSLDSGILPGLPLFPSSLNPFLPAHWTTTSRTTGPSTRPFTPDDLHVIEAASDEEILERFSTGEVLYDIHGTSSRRVARVSHNLVLKLSGCMREGTTQIFAAAQGLPVPIVRRVFSRPHKKFDGLNIWYILMDYVPGQTLEDAWSSMDECARAKAVHEVASMVIQMQTSPFPGFPPGPIGGTGETFWEGPYFTSYGMKPSADLAEMEDWFNHKLEVCIKYKHAPSDIPRFEFKHPVLTHQDIAPRNIMVDADTGRFWLIDWDLSGLYPPGLEQAAAKRQGPGRHDREFARMLMEALPEEFQATTLVRQLRGIMYGLTTGVLLKVRTAPHLTPLPL